jgi:hypothetical protein
MRNWKVTIEYKNRIMEVIIQANAYPEAYIAAELKYPGCVVKGVSEIRKGK